MFPFDLDTNVNKAMVQHRQEQVRAAFPRKRHRNTEHPRGEAGRVTSVALRPQ